MECTDYRDRSPSQLRHIPRVCRIILPTSDDSHVTIMQRSLLSVPCGLACHILQCTCVQGPNTRSGSSLPSSP
jgi:hypothetical protein